MQAPYSPKNLASFLTNKCLRIKVNLCLCSNLEWAQSYASLVQTYEVVITGMLGRKNTVYGCPCFLPYQLIDSDEANWYFYHPLSIKNYYFYSKLSFCEVSNQQTEHQANFWVKMYLHQQSWNSLVAAWAQTALTGSTFQCWGRMDNIKFTKHNS